ncbi:response regulator [Leptospira sp. 96542]|nr:response regulator [Leptospira sp. 96542]
MKICIVDDDQIYQFTTKKIISKAGFTGEVLTFSDAEEAFAFIQAEAKNKDELPDLIFLDINMPFMDGWQFLDAYQKIKNEIPKTISIFLVSSSVDEADTERAAQIPEVTGYIFKPFTKEKLLESIARIQS